MVEASEAKPASGVTMQQPDNPIVSRNRRKTTPKVSQPSDTEAIDVSTAFSTNRRVTRGRPKKSKAASMDEINPESEDDEEVTMAMAGTKRSYYQRKTSAPKASRKATQAAVQQLQQSPNITAPAVAQPGYSLSNPSPKTKLLLDKIDQMASGYKLLGDHLSQLTSASSQQKELPQSAVVQPVQQSTVIQQHPSVNASHATATSAAMQSSTALEQAPPEWANSMMKMMQSALQTAPGPAPTPAPAPAPAPAVAPAVVSTPPVGRQPYGYPVSAPQATAIEELYARGMERRVDMECFVHANTTMARIHSTMLEKQTLLELGSMVFSGYNAWLHKNK